MFKCKYCDIEYEKFGLLTNHANKTHKISTAQMYVDYFLNGLWPICECGCGQTLTKYRSMRGFARFAYGHGSKGENNSMFGQHHTPEACEAISTKRKEKFASGELKIWCEGLTKETHPSLAIIGEKSKKENNPERAAKITAALTGKKHSAEWIENCRIGITKAWEDPEMRQAATDRAIERLQTGGYKQNTGIELKLKDILNSLNIEYEFQKRIGNKLFDFVIESKKIIIEADGDFFHCNPIKWPDGPKYDTQHVTIENDQTKNELASANGYTLIRFWESDINDNPTVITEQLQKLLF